ncbi:tRNA pseudouridine(65) synthase TruC [Neisseria montereyensis]|uniref:tRNA pseudouridine synthase C n=1 Tax=Neisseria montereyensis TaxID=2973938 RepID=A0ABT2FEF7_9NEIS|nr:tRNA pseudouridine(65) synthase TruC [Neisseria montereyensis]MCS4533895.1 tRNA pseudouridine(65) synthase TruC [Neisseria montereyensis]
MLEILYQDHLCIAVNKPAGMLVHRSWLDRHETRFVMQTLRDQVGRHVFPVHRLDRPTSGVLLFAFDSDSARVLTQQFEQKSIQKTYWAVVRGHLHGSGRIDYPLKEEADKIADRLADPDKPAQTAITDYRCIAQTEQPFASSRRYPTSRYSWVALVPHTGRKHQLRRHLKHIFHPIVGDTTHGDNAQNRAVAAHIGSTRLMLHARTLVFCSPETGQTVRVSAPVDHAWQQLAAAFGWADILQT